MFRRRINSGSRTTEMLRQGSQSKSDLLLHGTTHARTTKPAPDLEKHAPAARRASVTPLPAVSAAGRTNRPRRRRFFSAVDIGRVSPGGADAGIAEAKKCSRGCGPRRGCARPGGAVAAAGRSEWWPVTVSERSSKPGERTARNVGFSAQPSKKR
jgi:hypothetical protein